MNVSKPVFMSAILLSVIGTAAAYPLVVNVNVSNFPLDEQGNLKVSSGVSSKVITLVKDLNMSWTATSVMWKDLTAEVDGYNELVIYASLRNWTSSARFSATSVSFAVDGIWTYGYLGSGEYGIYFEIGHPYTGVPITASALYHIRGPEVKLGIHAYSYGPEAGWMLVSISLYLRN